MSIKTESLATPATGLRPRFPIYVSTCDRHYGHGKEKPGQEIASFDPIKIADIDMDSYSLHVNPTDKPYAEIEAPAGTTLARDGGIVRLKVPVYRLGALRLLTIRAIAALDYAHAGRDGLKLIFGSPVKEAKSEGGQ